MLQKRRIDDAGGQEKDRAGRRFDQLSFQRWYPQGMCSVIGSNNEPGGQKER